VAVVAAMAITGVSSRRAGPACGKMQQKLSMAQRTTAARTRPAKRRQRPYTVTGTTGSSIGSV
jgi:hypothetical protein